MIADPDIEIVHICSPNYLHYSHSVKAIQAGKHVICEKPLTVTSEESAALVELAKTKQLACSVNYNLRYYPVNHEARELVKKGELGKIHTIHGSYLQDWLLLPTDWNWRLLPKEGGALCSVADIGSHWIDMVMFVTGLSVTEVMADLGTSIPVRKRPMGKVETFAGKMVTKEPAYEEVQVSGDDFANILFHFDNGAKGSLAVSQVSAGRKNSLRYEIDGSQSSVAWNSESPDELWRGYRQERITRSSSRIPRSCTPPPRQSLPTPAGTPKASRTPSSNLPGRSMAISAMVITALPPISQPLQTAMLPW